MMSSVFNGIIGDASNIMCGSNPSFSYDDFLSMFPNGGFDNTDTYPEVLVQTFIDMANANLNFNRWQSKWKLAMANYVAHYCTIYSTGSGQAIGLNTSESVGDVSVSMDYNAVAQGLALSGDWLLTKYGTNLATMAKSVPKGPMYVW
jgi:hypothetical protein